MNRSYILPAVFSLLYMLPAFSYCQNTFVLPDEMHNLHLQKLYKEQQVKEIKIYKNKVDHNDTSFAMILQQFFDENGNMLEEKNLETDRTILIFLDQNNEVYRQILFKEDKRVNSTYYYFNRFDRLVATEVYDRFDSLNVTNYFNYFEDESGIKCIISNSHGDTTQYEYLLTEDPATVIYRRFIYPDKLACEISYVLNDEKKISRRIHYNGLKEDFESWGFAYDNGIRFLGEKYNENQELTGTVEYFHSDNGLLEREIHRDRGGKVQHEIIYEYQRY